MRQTQQKTAAKISFTISSPIRKTLPCDLRALREDGTLHRGLAAVHAFGALPAASRGAGRDGGGRAIRLRIWHDTRKRSGYCMLGRLSVGPHLQCRRVLANASGDRLLRALPDAPDLQLRLLHNAQSGRLPHRVGDRVPAAEPRMPAAESRLRWTGPCSVRGSGFVFREPLRSRSLPSYDGGVFAVDERPAQSRRSAGAPR